MAWPDASRYRTIYTASGSYSIIETSTVATSLRLSAMEYELEAVNIVRYKGEVDRPCGLGLHGSHLHAALYAADPAVTKANKGRTRL